ncbi:universal stress protein [Herbiconiux liangxiaofengii]|uniref:universal stress protein n=1 Tax=Herbiconiux liangxiaofengii TaxID=3342795 RepID=UPI0035B6FAEC
MSGQSIVVGIDGSPASGEALNWAIREALVREARLELVTVITPELASEPELEVGSLDAATEVLREAEAKAEAAGVPASISAVRGQPAETLIDRSEDALFLVVGTRGRGGFAGQLMGGVSSTLAAHSHCPTVVVPDKDTNPMYPQRTDGIVVAVEPGLIDEAVWAGAEMASTHDLPLTLTAVRADTLGGARWLPDAYTEDPYPGEVDDLMDKTTAAVASEYPALTIRHHVLVGNPAHLLVGATETAELMILGTRGHSGFAGLLWGSVSQHVLQNARSITMIVRGHPTRS